MPAAASARRYAQAIYQIALEHDDLDNWLNDLTLLADAVSNPQFVEILDAPQFTVAQKTELVNTTLADSVDRLALNLISLLASKSIAYLAPAITEQYQKMLDAHRGLERADVVSAIPLSDDQLEKLTDLLQGIVGKEVQVTSRVDPQIIGGFIAHVGDRVIDGSTRAKLSTMRRTLVERA